MLSLHVIVDLGDLIMQAQENGATILSRNTEEIMRFYAQYLIFGIDVVTGIVIAISAAMAAIGFLSDYSHTACRAAHNRQRNN
jgi:hypothetical protein